jgi:hypothetical protein
MVEHERIAASEKPGHRDRRECSVLANAIETIVLRHFAAGRKGAEFGGDSLHLSTQVNFALKQRLARGTVTLRLIRKVDAHRCFLSYLIMNYARA